MKKSQHATGKPAHGLVTGLIVCLLLFSASGLWAQSPASQSASKSGVNLTVSQTASTIPEVLEFKLVAVNTTKADVSVAGNVIILDKQQKELTTGPYFVELKAGATKEDVCYAIVEKPDLVGSWKVIIDDVYDFILDTLPTSAPPPETMPTPAANTTPAPVDGSKSPKEVLMQSDIIGYWHTQSSGTRGWSVIFKENGTANLMESLTGPEARAPMELEIKYQVENGKLKLIFPGAAVIDTVYTLKDGKLVADPPGKTVLEMSK